jgi:hypothetical protein
MEHGILVVRIFAKKVWESNISFNKKYYKMNKKFLMCKVSVDTHIVSVD